MYLLILFEQNLKNNKFRVLLTSPEMMLEHPAFSEFVRSPKHMADVLGIVVDESHCISQWGGDFRKKYAEVEKVRSFIAMNVPLLAASATMQPTVINDVSSKLAFSPDELFLVNLGNDRANITTIVCRMDSAKNFNALDFVANEAFAGKELIRTIIYVNTRDLALDVWLYLKALLPAEYQDQTEFIHGRRRTRAKIRVMRKFRRGGVKILCATEVAGMVSHLK